DHPHRRRHDPHRRRRAQDPARGSPAGTPRQDRHGRRVRHEQLRCVHRAPRRGEREGLHGPRRPGGRRHRRHGRRAGRGRRDPPPGPAGLPRAPRPPVRVLHPRDAHAQRLLRPGEPVTDRGRGARGDQGQHVPVHRLPGHRRRGHGLRRDRPDRGGRPMTTTSDAPAEETTPEVGRARRRKEDQRLLTGRTRWTDNLVLPGMLHLSLLRSPVAHATITTLDTDDARRAPGVVGVWTGADLPEQGPMPTAWTVSDDMRTPELLPVSVGTVKHVGDVVAVVAATSKEAADDALELIDVDYDELPVVVDPLAARAEGSALVHPEMGTNVCATWGLDAVGPGTGGDVDEAVRAAEADPDQVVVRRTLRQNRITPAYMEPRSVVVDPTAEQVTLWSATQVPHIVRILMAMTQPIEEHELRVVAPDVGGGFGGKLQFTREEALVLLVARRVGVPCKYTESRTESMQSSHHARDQVQEMTLAARRDGTITALDVDLTADMGAYLGILTAGIPLLGGFMFNGIFKVPAYRFHCTDVFTHKTMTDAYRGAGKPEATFGIERMMDELAVELGMDPIEVR